MAKSAPAPTAPSISLASLKEMREKYLGGVQQLQQQLERTRSDLIATQGTVQFIEQQITATGRGIAIGKLMAVPEAS